MVRCGANQQSSLPLAALIVLVLSGTTRASAQDTTVVDSDSLGTFADSHAPNIVVLRHGWTSHHVTHDQIMSFPDRNLEFLLPLLSGVGSINGDLHFRGSRANNVVYLIDGFQATNPVTNGPMFSLIPEAMEDVEIHTGPFGVQFGRTTGGIVASRMRTGGDSLHISADIRTDDFAKPGNQFLGTSAFGYRNAVVTASGPLPFGVKFFVAGRHNYWRNRQVMFLESFRLDGLAAYENDTSIVLPAVEFHRNTVGNNWKEENTLQGNAVLDVLETMQFRLLASYSYLEAAQGGWPLAFEDVFRSKRAMIQRSHRYFGGATISHKPFPFLSYVASIGIAGRSMSLTDPDFGENWKFYSDSLANAQIGYTGFSNWYRGPEAYYTIGSRFRFSHPHQPNNRFEKSSHSSIQLSFQSRLDLSDNWRLQVGASSEWWTLRRYTIESITSLLRFLMGESGTNPREFTDEQERRVLSMARGSMRVYGYTVDGQTRDSGVDAPRTPSFQSAFLETGYESRNVLVTAGLRLERYDLQLPYVNGTSFWPYYNNRLNWVEEARLPHTSRQDVLLPRFSVSVRTSPTSSLYFAFGEYTQFIPLESILTTPFELSKNLPGFPHSYFYGLTSPLSGHLLQPERATQSEAGVSVAGKNDLWSFQAIVYSKNLRNLAQVDWEDPLTARWFVFKSHGEARTNGLEITLSIRPLGSILAQLNYETADAWGSASDPRETWVEKMIEDPISGALIVDPSPPGQLFPLEYSPSYRLSCSVQIHAGRQENAIVDGLAITAIGTFRSGARYTREHPGFHMQANYWNIGVSSLFDPRIANAAESPNASTLPASFNVDLHVSKVLLRSPATVAVSLDILNVFDEKHVINVYPFTGSEKDDGWFSSIRYHNTTVNDPRYEEMYSTINLKNRWAYMDVTGRDLFGRPRQIRIGLTIGL